MITDIQDASATGACSVCDAKAIGINFGVPTCAPCKAFFRRNARRKELLRVSCCHDNGSCSMHDMKTVPHSNVRRCSSCRLRRCFSMGMKEELIRTEEENIRHRKLVDSNRQRREIFREKQQIRQSSLPQYMPTKSQLLDESDWLHISNIVSIYDTHCLQTYLDRRAITFNNRLSQSDDYFLLTYSTLLPMNIALSLFSFFRALPAARSLSHVNQSYLCKTNIRPLLFLNMFELNQLCFTEQCQERLDSSTWRAIFGPDLYERFVSVDKLSKRLLITDPIITRLWIVVLYFSSTLFCFYDPQSSLNIPTKKTPIRETQNAYVTLLWNYLVYRYGDPNAIRIYSNLTLVYLKMQPIGSEIGIRLRTRRELAVTNKVLNQLLTIDEHECEK
ncbi:unnamed protein product [Adineta ricciae]|uniref:Nuclear receptor domain-containing protein n=1 Tax=Adineta ricciae TaxID=249248 RepID=A0A815DX61_ADIRI|nr:unnamed protein product [Adineta ricciae]